MNIYSQLCNHVILTFVEGQPESIVEDIENMVRSYVEKVRIDCI